MKDGFILYLEHEETFNALPDDKAGLLIKAIFGYERSKILPDDYIVQLAFIPIRQRLDWNRNEYLKKCEKNKANGYSGGRPKTERLLQKPNGGKSKPKKPDTDIDTDIELSKDNYKENNKRKKFQKPTLEALQAYCLERKNKVNPHKFIDHYESNGWMVGKNHMKDWKAAIRKWENNDGSYSNKLKIDTSVPEWMKTDIHLAKATQEEQAEIEAILGEFQ